MITKTKSSLKNSDPVLRLQLKMLEKTVPITTNCRLLALAMWVILVHHTDGDLSHSLSH